MHMTDQTRDFSNSYHFAEQSPDPYGGMTNVFPWCRVVRAYPGGWQEVVADFVFSGAIATKMATRLNLDA
jgi:hypothetical protein